jgi:hypothetical protein
MWFKSGSFAGLGTDAWLSNYAVGIGSTQVPNGVRLAAGNVQITENDISVVRNINASGIVTANSFNGNGANLTSLNASNLSSGTVPGTRGVVAGSANASFLTYSGTSKNAGQFYGGTTGPSSTTRLNYDGWLYATQFNGSGAGLSNIPLSGVSGAISGSQINTVTGSTTYYISATDNTSGVSSDAYVKSDIVMTGLGSVGIGTTNPTAKLDVNGTLNVTGVSTFQDNVNLGDNNKIILGDGDDLQLYHTSTNSYIDDTATGNLNIRSNGSFINLGTISGETMISAKTNGNVELFYDNSKKFETTSSGVSITGNIDVDNTTSIGSATSSLSTLTQTAIHTELAVATYRSVEYTIQATQGTNFHATKILALHNGTTAYHSEYGTIFNNSSVASFDVDISGGNLRLLATGASASQTDYVVNFVATKV